jgi:hypothetical protein
MEEWYTAVRNFKDASSNPYKTEEFCEHIFHSLSRLKIKDKKKFTQRLGPEFAVWTGVLEQTYSPQMITEILNDDDFWLLTLRVTGNILRS